MTDRYDPAVRTGRMRARCGGGVRSDALALFAWQRGNWVQAS